MHQGYLLRVAFITEVAVLVLSSLLLPLQTVRADSLPQITAVIQVDESGNATVKITFRAIGTSRIYFTLPKFENYSICEKYGDSFINNTPSSAYFYYNSSITLTPGANGTSILSICYNFPYASLLIDNQGWFMSPMLVSSPPLSIKVYVQIPNLEKVTLESPVSLRADKNGNREYVIYPEVQTYIPGRVVLEYNTLSPVSTLNFTTSAGSTTIIVKAPKVYGSLARRVMNVAVQAYNSLKNLTGLDLQEVFFVFYLPKQSFGGISTLGYIMGEDVNAGGKGPIMLNMALIRYAPGYLETTVIHEMIHAFLGRAGVEANDETRWLHEGIAQYLSITIAERLGYNVSDLKGELVDASQTLYQYLNGNFSLIQSWPSDPNLIGDAYLASFYVIRNLSLTYGGYSFLENVFKAIKSYGKVRTTQDIIAVTSMAAGKNLAPLYRSWGFQHVKDWDGAISSASSPSSSNNLLSTIILGVGLLIGILTYFLNEAVQREIEIAKHRSVFEKIEKREAYSTFST